MKPCLIGFDLDLTLVDTRSTLNKTAQAVLSRFELPVRPLTPFETGLSLGSLIVSLWPQGSSHDHAQAVLYFKEVYDQLATQATLYPGIFELLTLLQSQGHVLFLATQKRQEPAQRIIDHLHLTPFWKHLFFQETMPTKTQALIQAHTLAPEGTPAYYIGDHALDYQAASAARYDGFIHALWSGHPPLSSILPQTPSLRATSPLFLHTVLQQTASVDLLFIQPPLHDPL